MHSNCLHIVSCVKVHNSLFLMIRFTNLLIISLLATCQSLSTLPGGSMNLSSNGIVTTASFTCEVGSSLLGASLLTCQSDSTWDQTEPSCGNFCHCDCCIRKITVADLDGVQGVCSNPPPLWTQIFSVSWGISRDFV